MDCFPPNMRSLQFLQVRLSCWVTALEKAAHALLGSTHRPELYVESAAFRRALLPLSSPLVGNFLMSGIRWDEQALTFSHGRSELHPAMPA